MIDTRRLKQTKKISAEQAQARLENLCARAEHCSFEIEQKLRKWGIDESNSCRILENLKVHKFIDDKRYAAAFVNDKVKFARWGKQKIISALYAKKIDRSIILDVIDNIEEDEIELNLIEILRQKSKTITDVKTFQGRTKLFRFAISRGYSSEMISRIIRHHFA